MKNIVPYLIIALIGLTLFAGFRVYQLEKELNARPTIEKEVTVTVTKYDTIKVESKPIVITKYVDKPVFINSMDSTYLDSLYNALKDSALAGVPAIVEDTVDFGKHHLEVAYTFPPISKFYYQFLPGPDSLITEKITVTRVIDRTPLASLFVGPKMYQDEFKTHIGFNVGLRIKNLSGDITWLQDSKIYGVNYHIPVRMPTFKDIL